MCNSASPASLAGLPARAHHHENPGRKKCPASDLCSPNVAHLVSLSSSRRRVMPSIVSRRYVLVQWYCSSNSSVAVQWFVRSSTNTNSESMTYRPHVASSLRRCGRSSADVVGAAPRRLARWSVAVCVCLSERLRGLRLRVRSVHRCRRRARRPHPRGELFRARSRAGLRVLLLRDLPGLWRWSQDGRSTVPTRTWGPYCTLVCC